MEFDSEENCKAAKDSMEDCEIDGSGVTVIYAAPKGESSSGPAGGASPGTHSKKHKGIRDGITVNPTKKGWN